MIGLAFAVLFAHRHSLFQHYPPHIAHPTHSHKPISLCAIKMLFPYYCLDLIAFLAATRRRWTHPSSVSHFYPTRNGYGGQLSSPTLYEGRAPPCFHLLMRVHDNGAQASMPHICVY